MHNKLILILQVPILGYDVDPVSGIVTPLAGTMESVSGNGTVPIVIGEKAYDTILEQLAPVCGARRNPETDVVVPVTQDPHSIPKKKQIPRSVVSRLQIL